MTGYVKATILSALIDTTYPQRGFMQLINTIMTLLNVEAATAYRILDIMDCSGIDYSECTRQELVACIKAACAELSGNK